MQSGGNSSVGRARPCHGRGREFESRFPLQSSMAPIMDITFKAMPCQHGALAKRLCSGLQIRLVRFDSGTCLHIDKPARGLDTDCGARVVKSVDTRDLKSLDVRVVPVRFRPRAPLKLKKKALQIKQIRRFTASFLFLLPSVSPLSLFLSCPFLV